MRQIKFRAWDKADKVMFFPNSIMFDGAGTMMFEHANGGIKHSSSRAYCELMQYTGLKDSNGVDIYEGDLISMATKFRRSDTKHCKTVSWVSSEYKCGWNVARGEIYEVVGNIYQNPELLT